MSLQQSLSQIYLDANATTPVLPQAADAALAAMKTGFGNPSSSHVTGLRAKQIMTQTRERAQRILGSGEGEVIFTSGATEGIQTGIISALSAAKQNMDPNKKYCLLYGATEHKAVPESLKHWNAILGIHAEIVAIPVDNQGTLDTKFIAQHLSNALMICTMAVNNETGVYQDLTALEQVIRANNPHVYWMVDCVQALGKTGLNLADTTIDYAPFSGHKLYAPKGIGFVYIRKNAPFTPFIAGGGQEGGLRSGTENLPGMAALNEIFAIMLDESDFKFTPIALLHEFRLQMRQSLEKAFGKVIFNHEFENSVPTTLNFAIEGFSSKEIMDLFDAAGIRVSSGSACSSKVTRSFVLDAMGIPAWQSEAAIRMSFGPAMTQEEVNRACQRIEQSAMALGHSCLMSQHHIDDKAPLAGLIQFKVGGSCTWLYVDADDKSAIVIDPLAQVSERINTLIECQQLNLVGVIDTHGHADHESSRNVIADKYLAAQSSDHLGWPDNAETFELGDDKFAYIPVGKKWLVQIKTPGHTSDSISMALCEPVTSQLDVQYLFCGDTILMGSLGRTNFDCSNTADMFSSLRLIDNVVSRDALLCPSHDYNNEFTSSIDAEIARNNLLQQTLTGVINKSQFVTQKDLLDQHIVDESGSEIICGAFVGECQQQRMNEYDSDTLANALNGTDKSIKLIDIREPHEYALQHDQSFDENVPLTRFVQFINENKHDKNAEIVLLCRSGSRSHVAGQALIRLGFENVGHLKGGYALC
ncbi:aminotransferase class V-fold PLP-dependent enzyme [Psychrobium sp. nBUS_13]|uniref:aminotransferase class V-fold PLP-dependent enzyme n=1 Tax=Psychrobium sp. nBUS_13 TaxID=3395319 RepID=UPI003EB77A4F